MSADYPGAQEGGGLRGSCVDHTGELTGGSAAPGSAGAGPVEGETCGCGC